MSKEMSDYPFADKNITRYISAQIDLLKKDKSAREIAAEMGYNNANIISMFKRGESRVPLEKIPSLARALHVDVRHLFRLAMEDYWPGQRKALEEIFGTSITANEAQILEEIRRLTGNQDIALTADVRRRLHAAFRP